jgi:hypothetical protein
MDVLTLEMQMSPELDSLERTGLVETAAAHRTRSSIATPDLVALVRGDIPALHVPAYVPETEREPLREHLRALLPRRVAWAFGANAYSATAVVGLPFSIAIQRRAFDEYFEGRVQAHEELCRGLPAGSLPYERLMQDIARAWPAGAVTQRFSMARAMEFCRRSGIDTAPLSVLDPYDFWEMRTMVARFVCDGEGTDGGIHVDYTEPFIRNGFSSGVISANVYAETSGQGGELYIWPRNGDFWNALVELSGNDEHLSVSRALFRSVCERYPPIAIRPCAGDLILLNTKFCHSVARFPAGEVRSSFQGFIANRSHESALEFLI